MEPARRQMQWQSRPLGHSAGRRERIAIGDGVPQLTQCRRLAHDAIDLRRLSRNGGKPDPWVTRQRPPGGGRWHEGIYRGAGIRTRDLLLPKLPTRVDRRQPALNCLHLPPCPADHRSPASARIVTRMVTMSRDIENGVSVPAEDRAQSPEELLEVYRTAIAIHVSDDLVHGSSYWPQSPSSGCTNGGGGGKSMRRS